MTSFPPRPQIACERSFGWMWSAFSVPTTSQRFVEARATTVPAAGMTATEEVSAAVIARWMRRRRIAGPPLECGVRVQCYHKVPVRSNALLHHCATLCYMDEGRVGVRELRQNLTRYLRRVKRGERLEVTERGRPVAVLAPLGELESPLARLIASGRVLPPTGELLSLIPLKGKVSTGLTEALEEKRSDRL
jgi:prevent-host-death family protein